MKSVGSHYIVDYWGCSFAALDNLEGIRRMFNTALAASGANVIQVVLHKFAPQGVTGIAAIAESHVSIHTWPELGYAAIDVFCCGTSMNVEVLTAQFEEFLKPIEVQTRTIARGDKSE